MELKFFECKTCGNIVAMVYESGVRVNCCGKEMAQLTANMNEGAHEKHIPVYTIEDNIVHVRIGSEDHPMSEEHYIEWIALQTTQGNQRKCLKPGDPPETCFCICDGDKVEAIYAYCNIHGLWRTE